MLASSNTHHLTPITHVHLQIPSSRSDSRLHRNDPRQSGAAHPAQERTVSRAVGFPRRVHEYRRNSRSSLSETDIFQVGAYTAVDRDPRERVITIAYLAEIDAPVPVKGSDDAAHAQWFPLDALPPLAFDHAEILLDAKLIRSDE